VVTKSNVLEVYMSWWLVSVVVVIERSQVRLPAGALSSSNSGQVVDSHVPL